MILILIYIGLIIFFEKDITCPGYIYQLNKKEKMKKFLIIFCFIFSCSLISSQVNNFPALYCYDLTTSEIHEYNDNSIRYKKSIRAFLKKKNIDTLNFIYQGQDTFLIIIIAQDPEDDKLFLYDSDNKIVKIISQVNNEPVEKILKNINIHRDGKYIYLDKVKIKFVIERIDNLLDIFIFNIDELLVA